MEEDFSNVGMDVADLFVTAKLCKTKGEVRRMIKQNGIEVHGIKITDPFARVVVDRETNKLSIIEKRSH